MDPEEVSAFNNHDFEVVTQEKKAIHGMFLALHFSLTKHHVPLFITLSSMIHTVANSNECLICIVADALEMICSCIVHDLTLCQKQKKVPNQSTQKTCCLQILKVLRDSGWKFIHVLRH